MPLISGATAPTFNLHGALVTGLASPSRGARENSVWRVRVSPNTPAAEHSMDREEVIVALAGRAIAQLGDAQYPVEPGDGLVVPAHERFSLANPYAEPFEAVSILPVGARATMAGGQPFVPPWTE
jgi:mannose-6-phosphate isomerase-like protein (cupin superfamily)